MLTPRGPGAPGQLSPGKPETSFGIGLGSMGDLRTPGCTPALERSSEGGSTLGPNSPTALGAGAGGALGALMSMLSMLGIGGPWADCFDGMTPAACAAAVEHLRGSIISGGFASVPAAERPAAVYRLLRAFRDGAGPDPGPGGASPGPGAGPAGLARTAVAAGIPAGAAGGPQHTPASRNGYVWTAV